ncbi:hypothetical protein VNO77_25931 [Canavalia gladiata]|uniref:Uncharacterized protein n=1 Tax=Canavalia gladiata TaxID=3824 RepID=A0AAN9KSW5_CANGL
MQFLVVVSGNWLVESSVRTSYLDVRSRGSSWDDCDWNTDDKLEVFEVPLFTFEIKQSSCNPHASHKHALSLIRGAITSTSNLAQEVYTLKAVRSGKFEHRVMEHICFKLLHILVDKP